MEYKSIFTIAFKILRRAKLAWLFGLAYGLIGSMAAIFKLIPANLRILSCCLLPAWLFLYSVIPLGLLITLYYDYLNQPLTFSAVWKLIRTYIIRWTGLLILLDLPTLILVFYFTKLNAESNFLLVLLVVNLLNVFFFSFMSKYIFLTIFQDKGGFWIAIKQGVRVWADRLDIQFGIAIIYSIIHCIFFFLIVLLQSRLLISALTLRYHDLGIYENSSMSYGIPVIIFFAIVGPILAAIQISIYFSDIKQGVIPQNVL